MGSVAIWPEQPEAVHRRGTKANHFTGALNYGSEFNLDVTYHITVQPRHKVATRLNVHP